MNESGKSNLMYIDLSVDYIASGCVSHIVEIWATERQTNIERKRKRMSMCLASANYSLINFDAFIFKSFRVNPLRISYHYEWWKHSPARHSHSNEYAKFRTH